MFEDLDQKMQGEQADGRKTEMNRKHAYMMLMQDLENRLRNTKEQRERDIAEKEQALADAKGEKAETETTLAEDEKYLSELRQMCKTKTAEFEQRQELRQGEQDAIAKAVEILAGDAVSGAADKHLPGLVQKSLAQLRSTAVSPLQSRLAAFLTARASKVNSPILFLVATKMSNDPFTKVKKMIKDMITKLMEEANEE